MHTLFSTWSLNIRLFGLKLNLFLYLLYTLTTLSLGSPLRCWHEGFRSGYRAVVLFSVLSSPLQKVLHLRPQDEAGGLSLKDLFFGLLVVKSVEGGPLSRRVPSHSGDEVPCPFFTGVLHYLLFNSYLYRKVKPR